MPSMARAYVKKKRTLLAVSISLAVALVFNTVKPAFSTFHAVNETTSASHIHDYGHRASVSHQGHPPHTHKHTHRDGTTHEHQYHDEHCVKVSSNTPIECPKFSYLVPTRTWFPVLSNSTTPNFFLRAHYAELLRPPILA